MIWRSRSAYLSIGLVLFVGSLIPALHSHGTRYGGMPGRPFDTLAIVAVALQGLPLAVCRRWPVACLTLVSIGFAVDQLRGYHSFAGTALPVALLNTGSRLQRRRRSTTLLFSLAYVLFAVTFHRLGAGETLAGAVTFYLALVLAWGSGRGCAPPGSRRPNAVDVSPGKPATPNAPGSPASCTTSCPTT